MENQPLQILDGDIENSEFTGLHWVPLEYIAIIIGAGLYINGGYERFLAIIAHDITRGIPNLYYDENDISGSGYAMR